MGLTRVESENTSALVHRRNSYECPRISSENAEMGGDYADRQPSPSQICDVQFKPIALDFACYKD